MLVCVLRLRNPSHIDLAYVKKVVGASRDRMSQTFQIRMKTNSGTYRTFYTIIRRIRLGRVSNLCLYMIWC